MNAPLTESEINLRCAKFAGWKLIKDPSVMWPVKGEWWSGPDGQMSTKVPDYCNDPTAADELLRRLEGRGATVDILLVDGHHIVRVRLGVGKSEIDGPSLWRALAEAVAKMETGNG